MIGARESVVCHRLGDVIEDADGNVDALHAIDDALAHSTVVNNPIVTTVGTTALSTAADPADALRRVMHIDNNAATSGTTLRFGLQDGVNAAPDELVDEAWIEVEFEYAFTGTLSTTGDRLLFLVLEDLHDHQAMFRLRGGSPNVWQALNNAGDVLPAAQSFLNPSTLAAGTRYALRCHYQSESSDGALDGVLRVVTVNLDTNTVLHDTTVNECGGWKFGAFLLRCETQGTNVTTSDYYVDHITWSFFSAPGSMTATTGWFETYLVAPPRVGCMRTQPADTSKIEARVSARWPTAEIGPRSSATTKTAKFQYKASSSGTWLDAPAGAQTVTAQGWVHDSVVGLEPDTSYDFRVQFDRDSVVTTSEVATIRTLSASGSSPISDLTLGFYSCTSAAKQPVYPAHELARLGAQEVACMGDWSYTNTDMGYNLGSDYLAFNNARLALTAAQERRLEWHRLFAIQEACGQSIAAHRTAAHWVFVDDHLFRDDLAGERAANKSGDNLTMIQEIRGFVEVVNAPGFFPKDAGTTAGKYWFTRETARTLTVFVECRQKADHSQTNGVALPTDSSATPWAGEIGAGTNPFNRDNQGGWGTTVMGAEQGSDLAAAVAATTKPLVIIASGCIVSNGTMREYQDCGTYPEIWDVLQAAEDNPYVGAVVIVSHDLHLAMFNSGASVPSAARMAALGKASSYSKLLGEFMVGGGGQGGHRLRWQCGNTVDNDGGLRGGAWNGASNPRPAFASDANSRGAAVNGWEWDDTEVGYDGTDASGIGNTSKQERCTLLEIDEQAMTLTGKIVNIETQTIDYTVSASFRPAGGHGKIPGVIMPWEDEDEKEVIGTKRIRPPGR